MFSVHAQGTRKLPRTYYVDQTAGNDSNTGLKQDAAFKTIDKINGLTFLPNDRILFKRGETWQEQLTVPSSGASGRPITFGAYGTGARPILDGSARSIYINGKDYITIQDIQANAGTTANIHANVVNTLTLRNLITVGGAKGIYLVTISGTLIGSNLTLGGSGIGSSSQQFRIDSSTALMTLTDVYSGYAANYNFYVNGSTFAAGSSITRMTTEYASVNHNFGLEIVANLTINNIITRYAVQNGTAGSGVYVKGASSVIVFNDGQAYNNGWDGFSTDATGASDITFNRCISYNNGTAGQTANGAGDGFTTHQNATTQRFNYCIAYGNLKAGFALVQTSSGTLKNCVAYGNGSADAAAKGGIDIEVTDGAGWVYNNVISSQNVPVEIYQTAAAHALTTANYNSYYHSADTNLATLDGGSNFLSWTDYHTTGGHEANSIYGDPVFVSATDFRLQYSSPAINAGVDVSLTTDYRGAPLVGLPDMGAYEFGSPYYVDQTLGLDTNGGTLAAPWKTIAKINSFTFLPDDFIYFKKGETWRERLTVPSGGTSGHPITFGAYATGNSPILSGSDLVATWGQYGATAIYSAACTFVPLQVFENNVRLTNVAWDTNIATTAAAMSAGTWSLDDANNLLYVWASNGADPDTHVMEAGSRDYGASTYEKDYVTFSGIHFTKANISGLRPATSTGITITGCLADYNWQQGFSIYSDDAGYDSNINVSGLTASYNGRRGIYIGDYLHAVDIGTSTFDHNAADSNSDGSGVYIAGGESLVLYGVIVHDCIVHSNGKDSGGNDIARADSGFGIWVDQCGSNSGSAPVIFRRNITYDNENVGILLENSTDAQAYYNMSYDDVDGIYVSTSHASLFAIDCLIYNNVVYNSGRYSFHITGANTSGTIVKNNIFHTAGTHLFYHESGGTTTSDYNDYYDADFTNKWRLTATDYSTLANWRTALSQDANSISADPLFVNAAGEDFHLQTGSPAINAGVNVGLTTDYEGKAVGDPPEIGAYEYP